MTADPVPKFPKAECIVINGDIGGIRSRMRFFRYIFRHDSVMNAVYPVIGNHESRRQRTIIIKKVIPGLDSVRMMNDHSAHYFVDWKNARFIILDQYTDEAAQGCLGQKTFKWTTECIDDARSDTELKHVFVFFHEPAFPRHRHLDDSFNECPKLRDRFWRMLVANRDMVRSVFNGHTHSYSRIRIFDPESEEANNPAMFPDQENGIYQIDSGASGQGNRIAIIRIEISDRQITGRAVEAKEGWRSRFKLIDEWSF